MHIFKASVSIRAAQKTPRLCATFTWHTTMSQKMSATRVENGATGAHRDEFSTSDDVDEPAVTSCQ